MNQLHFSSTRKSDALRTIIRQNLENGDWKPGDQFPTEFELIDKYHVSRATVREAVASLVQEGLLRRVQGRGTFVAEQKEKVLCFAIIMPYLFYIDAPKFGAGTDVIPLMVQAIESECRLDKIDMMLMLDNREEVRERENLVRTIEGDYDAVILNYIGGKENLDCLRAVVETGPPVVLIDRYMDDLPTDYVVTDNAAGSEASVAQLEAAGFSDISYVTTPPMNSALRDREEGYRRAMKARGKTPRVISSAQALYELQHVGGTQIAFLTSEATHTSYLWGAMRERPDAYAKLGLAGFDEPYIEFPRGVTVVKVLQPLHDIGQLSVEIAGNRARARRSSTNEERREFKQIKLPPVLHVMGRHTGWVMQENR